MRALRQFSVIIILILAVSLLLGGCSKPVSPGISDDEVALKVDSLLKAMNDDNYTAFSQDFSQTMKDAIKEAQFEELKNKVLGASGNYIKLAGDPTKQSKQGYAVYVYLADFEKEQVKVTVSFAGGGDQVEGLFFDSKNMRQNPSQ